MTKVKSVVTELITQLRKLSDKDKLLVFQSVDMPDPLCHIETEDIIDYLWTDRDVVTLGNANLEQLQGHDLWPEGVEDRLDDHFSEVRHLLHVDKSKAQTLALEIVGEILGERLD